jgi:hypothetical protein
MVYVVSLCKKIDLYVNLRLRKGQMFAADVNGILCGFRALVKLSWCFVALWTAPVPLWWECPWSTSHRQAQSC